MFAEKQKILVFAVCVYMQVYDTGMYAVYVCGMRANVGKIHDKKCMCQDIFVVYVYIYMYTSDIYKYTDIYTIYIYIPCVYTYMLM